MIVATNKDKIDVPSKWIGESADKPGYSSTHNSKLSNDSPLKIKITRKVDYKHIMSKDRDKSAKFIATPSALAILSSGHEQSDKKDETDNNDPSNGIFAIGYWDAAYGDNKEYFWIGPFKSKTDAVSSARNVMKRGPKNINGDYLSGRVKYYTGIENFKNASKKVDLNPNLDDLSFK